MRWIVLIAPLVLGTVAHAERFPFHWALSKVTRNAQKITIHREVVQDGEGELLFDKSMGSARFSIDLTPLEEDCGLPGHATLVEVRVFYSLPARRWSAGYERFKKKKRLDYGPITVDSNSPTTLDCESESSSKGSGSVCLTFEIESEK